MTAQAQIPTTQFKFEGLLLERIIVHRIFPRDADKQYVAPKISNKLVKLAQEALDALQTRITKALGSKSHGIEMSISDVENGSFFQTAAHMLHADDASFVALSTKLADKLSKAQSRTTAPGGLLALISGRVGAQSKPFLAAIKAEPQDGFRADEKEDFVNMEYIAELLLTGTQRLYKIGLLAETSSQVPTDDKLLAANYRAFLFDHLMTATETRTAAAYFYSDFLGMNIQASSKKLTQDFFELTRTFIDSTTVSNDDKIDMHEALRSELRSQDGTISATGFATKHLDEDLRQSYEQFMQKKGFPQNSVAKDTGYIRAKLRRRRKYVFNNDVWISTPPDKPTDFLTIEPTDKEGTTVVRIKGQLQGQE